MDDLQNDKVERCEACGKVDDNTNSEQFIGCDICPNWFCKAIACSGIDLSSVVDASTIDFVCGDCQSKM